MSTSPSVADLIAFAKLRHLSVRDGGLAVNVGTAAAPIIVDIDSDADGRSLVLGCMQDIGLAAQLGQPAPSFDWDNEDDIVVTLSADQMRALALALYAYVQATYAARRQMLSSIEAGTVTTFAGIGDPSLWPARTPDATAAATPTAAS